MKLSTKVRYAARALFELARAHPDGKLTVKDIASKQNISPKYLENIMSSLKASGLVKPIRGIHRGYGLAKLSSNISLKELFEALEGSSLAPVYCVDYPNPCFMVKTCPTHQIWVEMKKSLERVLAATTIQDLVDRKRGEIHLFQICTTFKLFSPSVIRENKSNIYYNQK